VLVEKGCDITDSRRVVIAMRRQPLKLHERKLSKLRIVNHSFIIPRKAK